MTSLCRVCETATLYPVLDMGRLPLAGDFRPAGERNELYSLAIDACEGCGLLQVRETVDPHVSFGPTYCYASSTIAPLVRHFAEYAEQVALSPDAAPKRLLEVGCNDGVFLDPLSRAGYAVVGVDASDNVARIARGRGLKVHTGLFDERRARVLTAEEGRFDVVTCSNVFAHNPGVNEFVAAVDGVLSPSGGEFWVEVHSGHELHRGLQWDCFYHEHCFYWTIQSLRHCLQRHGYRLIRYQMTPMHGGAIRAAFSKSGPECVVDEVPLTRGQWEQFAADCGRSRMLLRDCVDRLGLRFAYGAAGRAVTLINWSGIGELLDFAVDGSPLRYGKTVPGTAVPIISEEEFFTQPRDAEWCFVTAHNYLQAIREKVEARFPGRGVKFVTPLPYVSIR